ncbi:uncharacterized protein LOC111324832 [Stylophora pistillata]|uniref:uncharacterized protein LOC111324832 n=1 Tax=Stylophora pistillata TaxID=50429 RepID=UPI000C046FC8|nr:uncharacterized protein LOC111324832 [Stylophora pistillata]
MFHITIFIILLQVTCGAVQEREDCHSSLHNKQSEVRDKLPAKNLTKIYTLKHSLQRNPFDIWYFKDKFKSLEDLLLTTEKYNNQIVERQTTKYRLRNVMGKVLLGQDIGLIVMGGSTSAGGGLINDFSNLKGVYYRVFVDWWQKAIQPFTGSRVKLRNLAVGGTSSDFFYYCYKTLMRPEDNSDIIFLELSINDYLQFKDSKKPSASSLEKLTRQLLEEKSSPAVVYVNFTPGSNNIPICDNLENHGQTMLAWHYGITSFSMRESLCSNDGDRQFPAFFASDGNHSGNIAQAQIAMMIINNVRNTLLDTITNTHRGLFYLRCIDLPRPVYFAGKQGSVPGPLCYSHLTPDVSSTFFNPSLSVTEIEITGFKRTRNLPISVAGSSPLEKKLRPVRTDGFGGWEAEKVNSTLQLKIDFPFDGISGDNQTRDVIVAFRTNGYGGKAEVSLDKRNKSFYADAYSIFGYTRLVKVARRVTPGSHNLSFKIVKSGKFALCGIMTAGPEPEP